MAPCGEHADTALRPSEKNFRLMIDAVRDHALFMLDPAGRIINWNDGAERMTGWSEAEILGGSFAILLGSDAAPDAAAERLCAMARRDGRVEEEGRHRRRDGAIIPVITTLTVLSAPSGIDHGFAAVMRDVTESRRAEDRQRVLVREVDHRTKNALAVVQAILRLSVAPDMPSFIRVVEGRVAALARIHTLIALHDWQAAPLDSIIGDELAALDPLLRSRIAASGAVVWLVPKAAQAIALTLHELATNALRHGALAVPKGRIAVNWHRDDLSDALVVGWVERDGPRVPKAGPESFGFGIVRAMIETQLEGLVQLQWDSGDLSCRLSIPKRHVVTL